MKCKLCKGTHVIAQVGPDGDVEGIPCDCTYRELMVNEDDTPSDYYKELHSDGS